jgi:sugar/nucleoside kinase (ribokinase family)
VPDRDLGPDVLVLGGCGADTVVPVPALPLPARDSVHVPGVTTRAGQTGDNVALGLAALGLRVVHADVLGDDPEGDLVRALHAAHGVPLVTAPARAGTRRAVNLVAPDGRRLSLYDSSRADPADRLPGQVAALARSARLVHVAITAPCAEALAGLPDAVPVATDLHDWDGSDPYHLPFARRADLVFLSGAHLADAAATARAVLAGGRARVVVVTAGAAGGLAFVRGEAEPRGYQAARPVGPAVDSNGAGDAFVAGYLFGHLAGAPVDTCLRYGAVAGAHACTVPAARTAPLDPATLRERAG